MLPAPVTIRELASAGVATLTDDAIRRHWRSFDTLQPYQKEFLRRAWATPPAPGDFQAVDPRAAQMTIFGGRRTGRTAEQERHARELLAAGHRVFEMSDKGLREVRVDAAGELIRDPARPSGRAGSITFDEWPHD